MERSIVIPSPVKLANRRVDSETHAMIEDVIFFDREVGHIEYHTGEDEPWFILHVGEKAYRSNYPDAREYCLFQLLQVGIVVDRWGEITWCGHQVGEIVALNDHQFASRWLDEDGRLYPHTTSLKQRIFHPEAFISQTDAAIAAVKLYIIHNFPEATP